VRIAWYSGNVRQGRFDLQISSDNTTWTNVITGGLSSGTTTAEQELDFADRSAQWVRYLGHGNTVNSWNSLYEVSVFASGTVTPTATPTPTPIGASPTPTPTPTPTAVQATPTPTPTAVPGSANLNAAPYVMPRDNNPPDITTVINATGVKAYTIAFILANGSSCSPAWDGVDPISSDTVVAAYINKIRQAGGDVVPSIGGYGGTKLGQVCGSATATADAYDQVVNKYGVKAMDFDIEEPEIENAAAVANELGAAKILQSRHPGLNVSVTLPVTTTGLNWFAGCNPNNADAVLSKAKTLGFTPTTWNVMPFDGGFPAPMGTTTCNVLQTVHDQVKACFGWDDATTYAHQGVSLMNGRSDTGEYTTVSDFNTIRSCVKSHGMKRMTFWSVNRDRSCNAAYGTTDPGTKGDCSSVAQNPWDFTKVFAGF
jgi:chitinase